MRLKLPQKGSSISSAYTCERGLNLNFIRITNLFRSAAVFLSFLSLLPPIPRNTCRSYNVTKKSLVNFILGGNVKRLRSRLAFHFFVCCV